MTSEAPHWPWTAYLLIDPELPTAYLIGPGFHVGKISFCFVLVTAILSLCYSQWILLIKDIH